MTGGSIAAVVLNRSVLNNPLARGQERPRPPGDAKGARLFLNPPLPNCGNSPLLSYHDAENPTGLLGDGDGEDDDVDGNGRIGVANVDRLLKEL